jgi:hypothetical protein
MWNLKTAKSQKSWDFEKKTSAKKRRRQIGGLTKDAIRGVFSEILKKDKCQNSFWSMIKVQFWKKTSGQNHCYDDQLTKDAIRGVFSGRSEKRQVSEFILVHNYTFIPNLKNPRELVVPARTTNSLKTQSVASLVRFWKKTSVRIHSGPWSKFHSGKKTSAQNHCYDNQLTKDAIWGVFSRRSEKRQVSEFILVHNYTCMLKIRNPRTLVLVTLSRTSRSLKTPSTASLVGDLKKDKCQNSFWTTIRLWFPKLKTRPFLLFQRERRDH